MDVDTNVDFDEYESLVRQRADQLEQLAQKQMSGLSIDTSRLNRQMDEAVKNINERMEHELSADNAAYWDSRRTTATWLILVISSLIVLVLVIKFIALMLRWYKQRQSNPSYFLDHRDLFLVCCPLYSLVIMSMQRSTPPGFYYAQNNTTGCHASPQSPVCTTAAPLPPDEYPAPARSPSATAYPEYPPSYDTARLLPGAEDDHKVPPY